MTALFLTAAASVFLLLGVLWFGNKKAGYSHATHTISELGEINASDQGLVGWGVFFPVGLLTLVVAYLIGGKSPTTGLLALCIAIGYLVAAVFPCDAGAPTYGSARNSAHMFAGGIEYFGGGFALIALAEHFGQFFKVTGSLVLGSAVALTFMSTAWPRGAIQRIAEASLFVGLMLAVWFAESAT